MPGQLDSVVRWLLCWLIVSSTCHAANFTHPDPQVVATAEAARLNSARFWTGQPLPGDWSCPCPIQATLSNSPGSGSTRFTFANGEVFNWSMSVQGTRTAILADVIPHEVDHMVRATLARRPIVRWLDEGCAAQFESESSKSELRLRAARLSPDVMSLSWLSEQRYPESTEAVSDLYAAGFSLVEYLLTLKQPDSLLQLQKTPGSLSVEFPRIYEFSLSELPQRWDAWRQGATAASRLPVLLIWTADWCGPCRQFKWDFNSQTRFHDQLTSHYQIQFIDFDRNSHQAQSAGVRSLPAFQTPEKQIAGYTSPRDLLMRLGLQSAANVDPPPLASSPQVTAPSPDIAPVVEPAQQTVNPASSPLIVPDNGSSVPQALGVTPAVQASGSILDWIPVGMSVLQMTGIIGGSAVTGGIGGVALSLFFGWLSLRRATRNSKSEGSSVLAAPAPFPRRLDEASQLLGLRQSEGRVPVLDALRGMFLDDELEKFRQSSDPIAQSLAQQIQSAIDQRVDEVAPLST